MSILAEADIRATALNGGNLVPKQGCSYDEIASASLKLQNLVADLLFTINHVDVSGGHKTAACNLLCTVISQCSQSRVEKFQSLIWDDRIWELAFDVYLTQNHALSVKPLRQLLTTLTSTLDKCANSSVSASVKVATLQRLASILCSTTEHVPIRPAMQALAHFLIKKLVTVSEVYEAICHVHGVAPVSESNVQHATLLETTLRWAPYDDYSSSAGLLASAILENIKAQASPEERSTRASPTFYSTKEVPWASPVLKVLAKDPTCLENYRHYVLPELFKHDLQDFVIFLEHLGLHRILGNGVQESTRESALFSKDQLENVLFCALSVGNKTDLVRVTEGNKSTASNNLFLANGALCIPDTVLGSLLLRQSTTVRIAGLSMLVASTSTTKPLSLGTIRALRKGLPHLHAEADAGFRSEMFSLIRNLTDRLRGATLNLSKISTRHGTVRSKINTNTDAALGPEDAAKLLSAHYDFLQWYLRFLKTELRPSASYQRHISAVKCIALVYKSGVDSRIPISLRAKTASPTVSWPFHIDVIDGPMTDLLLDLLLDPFDDVRQEAAEILSIAPAAAQNGNLDVHDDLNRLVVVLQKAEHMMRSTGRADQADGVAHLYNTIFSRSSGTFAADAPWWTSKYGVLEHLLQALEQTLEIAANDMSRAVSKHPLHGIFISLRYIIETPGFYKNLSSAGTSSNLQSLHLRLYASFHSVWTTVEPTLCNDAPEGYVPDEVDEEDDVGTKDVLSYSWRALKEASLLMRAIVKDCPLADSDTSLLTPKQLRDLGDLSFTQLAQLRHRGAFSTVSQTFAACCLRCSTGVKGALQEWYQQAMLCIQNQTTINTRRSAGIPSLMVGIVVADESRGDLYQKAMHDLTLEATKPVDETSDHSGGLSQVHAMNCLKDMFRNSKLGERSEAHVPEALGLAAECLSSNSWAIRNSGLMLFRALLDRLLGTNESYVSNDTAPQSRLSFTAVPNLMNVIFRLISPPLDTTEDLLTEGVFPALQLLQRTPPPHDQLQAVQDAVLRLTASSQWHIRDKAAQTYAILTRHADRIVQAARLITSNLKSHNATHGALLSARYILQNSWSSATHQDLEAISQALHEAVDPLYLERDCPFTKAAFIDIYRDWCQAAYRIGYTPSNNDHRTTLSAPVEIAKTLDIDRDAFAACSALRQALAHAVLHEYAYLESIGAGNQSSLDAISKLAMSADADACAVMLAEAAKCCTDSNEFRKFSGKLLTKFCASLLFDAAQVDIEIQTSAQDVLLVLLDSQESPEVEEVLLQSIQVLYLPNNAATPLFQDKRLILQGALLELRFRGQDVPARSLPNDFGDWTNSVRSALHEDNPFDTRLAAAQAAARINHGLRTVMREPEFSAGSLTFCLAVYDLTNDDDEEVRNVAARIACGITQITQSASSRTDLTPLPAGAALADSISQRFGTSDQLATVSISRLTGGAVAPGYTRLVQDILADAKKQDTALFIQEKQNLFVDDAREARLWSHVLMQLSPKALPLDLIKAFATWTLAGINTLLYTLDPASDGPLGWKRRPDVFVVGLRVIYAAEALLVLSARSKRAVPVSTVDIRSKLAQLLAQGTVKEMHPTWLAQSGGVLERAILRGIGRVATVVSTVLAQLDHQ